MRTGAFPGVVAVGFCQTGAFRLLDIPLRPIEGKMPKSVSSVGGIYTYPEHSIETADSQSVWKVTPEMEQITRQLIHFQANSKLKSDGHIPFKVIEGELAEQVVRLPEIS